MSQSSSCTPDTACQPRSCTARARVTKLFLHTGHCVSATKRLASPRWPCTRNMCVRNAASDSKIVSQTSHLCTVDAAATTSPKLYARKSRAHATCTMVCHALGNLIHKIFHGLGSALNSGRSDNFHPSLARRACKSSVISAIHGVVFPPAFCRRALSCGSPARAARAWYAWYAQFRTELGIRCAVSCTTTSPCTLTQHPHVSRVETPQHCRRVRTPSPRSEEKDGPQQRICQPQFGPE